MKTELFVTRDFQEFINSCFDLNYQEVYELYQAAEGNEGALTVFEVLPARGSTEEVLLVYVPGKCALRLSTKARDFFKGWIETNLMDGLDAESYWGMHHAMENDKD